MSEHVIAGLAKLEVAFDKVLKPAQAQLYEMRLDDKRITAEEMRAAVDWLIDNSKSFPRIAAIVEAARPPGRVGPRDESQEPVADQLDREEKYLREWLAKFEIEGNEMGARDCRDRIERCRRDRASRGLTSKLRPFEGSLFDGTPTKLYEREWTEEDLLGPDGVNRGYPNNVSRAAAARAEERIRVRFGDRAVREAREFGMRVQPAMDLDIGHREAAALAAEELNPFG